MTDSEFFEHARAPTPRTGRAAAAVSRKVAGAPSRRLGTAFSVGLCATFGAQLGISSDHSLGQWVGYAALLLALLISVPTLVLFVRAAVRSHELGTHGVLYWVPVRGVAHTQAPRTTHLHFNVEDRTGHYQGEVVIAGHDPPPGAIYVLAAPAKSPHFFPLVAGHSGRLGTLKRHAHWLPSA